MSYAVGTTHYNLPQTQGTDKRDWSDTNQAFADIDAAIYGAGDDASTALSTAQTAQTTATSAASDASTAVTTANAASATAQTASEVAALARTEAQGASTVAGQANTAAQAAQATASNADTVALAAQTNIGTMANLQTTDKSSLVAAINEVLSQTGGGRMELDFSNAVTLTTGMTSSVNGAIILSGILPASASVSAPISVNGKQVGRFSDAVNRDNYILHGVCVGDVITFSDFATTGVEMLLVPYK